MYSEPNRSESESVKVFREIPLSLVIFIPASLLIVCE